MSYENNNRNWSNDNNDSKRSYQRDRRGFNEYQDARLNQQKRVRDEFAQRRHYNSSYSQNRGFYPPERSFYSPEKRFPEQRRRYQNYQPMYYDNRPNQANYDNRPNQANYDNRQHRVNYETGRRTFDYQRSHDMAYRRPIGGVKRSYKRSKEQLDKELSIYMAAGK
ncbi:hypothetical protein NCER_100823 [Vairimorpha ceranae BRL01]|uniref:Uncharacterized protein n=2 Tax=Vairimorpha ceranae TaxID=40302 RepID=C4V8J3_VAIC1|nr:hypothetical protein AAJ76_3800022264 [Vairimorpha ceranae]EEQ82467.1 hypothetical protein NCER_100823 [Vairimorpha ceranae BRL01]KAF5140267.1 hypothetical protein G9O61_00g015230 [Vairimorpha ceranae]KKO74943.1 hypothetical protein AAJ76_3800022264 [Vairimorpha ceranae]